MLTEATAEGGRGRRMGDRQSREEGASEGDTHSLSCEQVAMC